MNKVTKKFCPRCGSTNIKWTIPQNWSIWECFDCGYMGPVVVEDEEIADELRKSYNSSNKHNKSQ